MVKVSPRDHKIKIICNVASGFPSACQLIFSLIIQAYRGFFVLFLGCLCHSLSVLRLSLGCYFHLDYIPFAH